MSAQTFLKSKVAVALCLLVSSWCVVCCCVRCALCFELDVNHLRIPFIKSHFWHVHHAWESIERLWQHRYQRVFFLFCSLVGWLVIRGSSIPRFLYVWMSKRVFLIALKSMHDNETTTKNTWTHIFTKFQFSSHFYVMTDGPIDPGVTFDDALAFLSFSSFLARCCCSLKRLQKFQSVESMHICEASKKGSTSIEPIRFSFFLFFSFFLPRIKPIIQRDTHKKKVLKKYRKSKAYLGNFSPLADIHL